MRCGRTCGRGRGAPRKRENVAGEVVAYVPDQCVLVAGAADVGGVALVLQVTLAELHQARVGHRRGHRVFGRSWVHGLRRLERKRVQQVVERVESCDVFLHQVAIPGH